MNIPFIQRISKNEFLLYLTVILFSGLSAWPLLLIKVFAIDWINHLWFALYSAHWIFKEGHIPTFINTSTDLGNPLLAFYGSGLYGTVAPFVWLLGPDGGIRVAAYLALLLPNFSLVSVLRHWLYDRVSAACLLIILSSSVYQLTNLYSRSALTEFFAYQCLIFSIALFLRGVSRPARSQAALRLFVGILAAGLACLSHPPTFYLTIIFVLVPGAIMVLALRPNLSSLYSHWKSLLAASLIVAVPLLAWLNLVWVYGGDLNINADSHLIYFPWSIDSLFERLSPWPLDLRSQAEGFEAVSTPNLNAPLNTVALFVLLVFATYNLKSWRKSKLSFRWMIFGLLSALSIVASLVGSLPYGHISSQSWPVGPVAAAVSAAKASLTGRLLGPVQFAYRVVNASNLTVILACLGATFVGGRIRSGRPDQSHWIRPTLMAAAALCVGLVFMKVQQVYLQYSFLPRHAVHKLEPPNWASLWVSSNNIAKVNRDFNDISAPPSTEYGITNYATRDLFGQYTQDGGFTRQEINIQPIGTDRAVADAWCDRPCALSSRVLASPFIDVRDNGESISRDSIRASSKDADRIEVLLNGPANHHLEFRFGNWNTKVLSYSVTALAVSFWLSGLALLSQSLCRLFRRWVFTRQTIGQ